MFTVILYGAVRLLEKDSRVRYGGCFAAPRCPWLRDSWARTAAVEREAVPRLYLEDPWDCIPYHLLIPRSPEPQTLLKVQQNREMRRFGVRPWKIEEPRARALQCRALHLAVAWKPWGTFMGSLCNPSLQEPLRPKQHLYNIIACDG